MSTKCRILVFWAAMWTGAVGLAMGQGGDPTNVRLTRLRERAKEVQSRTFGRAEECASKPYLECIGAEVGELRELVREYSVWKLNESRGDIDALRADFGTVDDGWVLERFRLMDGASEQMKHSKDLGIPPHVFRKKDDGPELIVVVHNFGSAALAFPSGIEIIQGFRKEGGQYVFASETGDSIYGIMNEDTVQALPSPVGNEMWLLISGQMGGFMGHLERTRIYSFDGYGFQERWKPEDREIPRITVTGGEIRTVWLGPKFHRSGGDLRECMDETVKLFPTGAVQVKLANSGECGDPHKR